MIAFSVSIGTVAAVLIALAIWRFDGQLQSDGTVLDETGHGHNAHPHGTVKWLDNQKCPF